MADKLVKKGDMVTVFGTGKAKFLEKNKPYKVHSLHADALIGAGKASKEKAKEEASK